MLLIGLITLGLTVAIFLWLLGIPWLLVNNSNSKPLGWPWLVFFGNKLKPLVTWKMRQNFVSLQSKSNLADYWQVQIWFTHKLSVALLIAALCSLLGTYFDVQPRFISVLFIIGSVFGYLYPEQKLKLKIQKRKLQMQRELPFMLDLLSLSVHSGLSLGASLKKLAESSPDGPLRDSLRKAQGLERTGIDRNTWLMMWAEQTELIGVQNLALSLIQADKLGMNLGPLLKSQAQRQRSERFIRAEALALKAPVKMLFPMVICIFPCTFLIIGFPILVKLLNFGV